MLSYRHAAVITFVSCLSICLVPRCFFPSPLQTNSRRVCVIAVRDSSLFTLCPTLSPGSLPGGGTSQKQTMDVTYLSNGEFPGLIRPWWMLSGWLVRLPPYSGPQDRPILESARPDWRNLAGTTPGICPLGKIDPELRSRIEKELRKQRDYVLVDSPAQADVVFLAEGITAYYYKRKLPDQTTHYEYFGGSDEFGGDQRLQVAMAIVVPSDAYLKNPDDGAALLEAKIWEGWTG
jgi:hypothetical protein